MFEHTALGELVVENRSLVGRDGDERMTQSSFEFLKTENEVIKHNEWAILTEYCG